MENSRKVTHGCIIATLKLYLPDGKEAKASPTIMSSLAGGGVGNGFACNGNLQTQSGSSERRPSWWTCGVANGSWI